MIAILFVLLMTTTLSVYEAVATPGSNPHRGLTDVGGARRHPCCLTGAPRALRISLSYGVGTSASDLFARVEQHCPAVLDCLPIKQSLFMGGFASCSAMSQRQRRSRISFNRHQPLQLFGPIQHDVEIGRPELLL
jgi:hypothetical protein